MRILALDIETAPNAAYVWGLFKQNIGINQISNSGYVMCWSAKWVGEDGPTMFASIYKSNAKRMLRGIHKLLDEADVVLTYNGNSFDLPTLAKEFVLHEMNPPTPYKSIDLCKVVQSTFKFASSKLDFVCQALGLGAKVRHVGFELWVRCMAKEAAAWKDMEAYNRQDVAILEKLYFRLRPWIRVHPNVSTMTDTDACPKCGSAEYQRRGFAYTDVYKYQQYQCNGCKSWFRDAHSLRTERKHRFRKVA